MLSIDAFGIYQFTQFMIKALKENYCWIQKNKQSHCIGLKYEKEEGKSVWKTK